MPPEYKISAIPTMYKGRRYRSRLEAKWAAFFDILGFKFEYEPTDLGRWSPDFQLIRDDDRSPIFVEVKPISSFESDTARKMVSAAQRLPMATVVLVGVAPLLLCGATPDDSNAEWRDTGATIGWTSFVYHTADHCSWAPAYICLSGGNEERFDIFSDSFPGGMLYDGDIMSDTCPPWGWRENVKWLKLAWAKATNLVQWHPGDLG